MICERGKYEDHSLTQAQLAEAVCIGSFAGKPGNSSVMLLVCGILIMRCERL